jgi:AmiR/NasT family two-component response regulator
MVSYRNEAKPQWRVVGDYITAFLTLPVRPSDLRIALAVSLARFRIYIRTQRAREDGKVIERATGAMRRRLGVDEKVATKRLRKAAGHWNIELVDAARNVLEAEEVFHDMEIGPSTRRAWRPGQGAPA